MKISLIVAMAKNRVIGRDNAIPWHVSTDLKRFKQLTIGHHIIMGRKTYESIGKLLPNRTTVIVTRNPDFVVPGAVLASSLEAAISACRDDDEVFIIGGAELFKAALPLADKIYLTIVDAEVPGDTFMPEINMRHWEKISSEFIDKGDKDDYRSEFLVYNRSS